MGNGKGRSKDVIGCLLCLGYVSVKVPDWLVRFRLIKVVRFFYAITVLLKVASPIESMSGFFFSFFLGMGSAEKRGVAFAFSLD